MGAMDKMKKWLSEQFPALNQPIVLRSYPTLAGLFLVGLIFIGFGFYTANQWKGNEVSALETQKEELENFLLSNANHQSRMEMPEVPSKAKGLVYAKKVPLQRELPRFLVDLQNIAEINQITFTKMDIQEVKPESHDLVTAFLAELGTLAKEVQQAKQPENKDQPNQDNQDQASKERVFVESPEKLLERFIVKAEADKKQEQEEAKVTKLTPELLQYIPFGIIRFHVEFEGTLQQLRDVHANLRQLDRLVHVEKWDYLYAKESSNPFVRNISLDFEIFYYKEKLEHIPQLPELEVEYGERDPILAIPKAWLEEEPTSESNADSNSEETIEEIQDHNSEDVLKESLKDNPTQLLPATPPEAPQTKD